MVSGLTKVKYVGGNSRKTTPEEYIIVQNTHEPIIDKEQFYRVRPKKLAEPRSKKREKVLLDGLLRVRDATVSLKNMVRFLMR